MERKYKNKKPAQKTIQDFLKRFKAFEKDLSKIFENAGCKLICANTEIVRGRLSIDIHSREKEEVYFGQIIQKGQPPTSFQGFDIEIMPGGWVVLIVSSKRFRMGNLSTEPGVLSMFDNPLIIGQLVSLLNDKVKTPEKFAEFEQAIWEVLKKK